MTGSKPLTRQEMRDAAGEDACDFQFPSPNTVAFLSPMRGVTVLMSHGHEIMTATTATPGTIVSLNPHGWHTVTTAQRLDWCLRILGVSERVRRESGCIWYGVVPLLGESVFRLDDGCLVLTPETAANAVKHRPMLEWAEKRIRLMCQRARNGELPLPDAGDCLLCSLDLNPGGDGRPPRCGVWHLADGYLQGSLIARALERRGYHPLTYSTLLMGAAPIARALRTYLRAAVMAHPEEAMREYEEAAPAD